jgi:hypothetical protein
MKKIFNNTIIWSMVLSLISPSSWAIDLNTKIKNTDRSLFNSNPGVKVQEGFGGFFLEYNMSGSPLVVRNKTTGKVEPLVSSSMGLDVGANYGLTSWLQLGVLVPLEMHQGTEKSAYSLVGPYFEAKFKINDSFAFVPSYQLSSSSKISVNLNNQISEIPMGSPNGTFGGKVVYQKGNVLESWGLAAQVGYYSSPENTYLTIDQSSRILVGASAGMPLSESVNGIVEVYGEKMEGAFPVEVIGLVNLKGETVNWQVGAGSGNIQGSGSNTYKAFVGLTYFFGGETKSASRGLPTLSPRKNNVLPTAPSRSEPSNPILEDDIDEQQGPEVLEPEQTKDPAIPDVNNNSLDNYSGRNLASVTNQSEVVKIEEKKEVKKVEKKAKQKTRFATLPNGQKVKVFEKEVTELPKEVNVIYTTEAGYKDLVKQIKVEQEAEKVRKAKLMEQAVNQEMKTVEIIAPVKIEPIAPVQDQNLDTQIIQVEQSQEEIKPSVENSVAQEVKPDVKMESKELPMVAKEKEVDPVPMMGENPPVQITPVQVVEKKEEEIKIVPVDVEALLKQQQQKQVEVAPVVAQPVENKVEVKEDQVPKVSISLEQREELKNRLLKDFENIPLEEKRKQVQDKISQEQAKINEEIAKKEKAEAEAKAQKEAEEIAQKAAEEEKSFRENAPLAESKEAVPGKAATEEELKPVQIGRKNRKQVIIQLPQQRLDAFLKGEQLPRLQAPIEASESAKSMNLLEEETDVEEASGPSYGFGSEE